MRGNCVRGLQGWSRGVADRLRRPGGSKPKTSSDSKTNYATAFFDSIGQSRKCSCLHGTSLVPSRADVARPRPKFILSLMSQAVPIPLSSRNALACSRASSLGRELINLLGGQCQSPIADLLLRNSETTCQMQTSSQPCSLPLGRR